MVGGIVSLALLGGKKLWRKKEVLAAEPAGTYSSARTLVAGGWGGGGGGGMGRTPITLLPAPNFTLITVRSFLSRRPPTL